MTKEEQTTQRRKGERNAYVSIRMIGFVLIARAFLVVMNLGSIYKYGIVAAFAAVACAAALAASGAGVMRFAHLAVYPACLILASFFVLPFTSLFEDDKGAPFMITLGLIGLYYLMRRPARQISRLVLRATPPGGAFNRLLASFHTEQELICEEKINGFVGRSDW